MCAWHKYFPWSPKTAFAHQYLQECCSGGKTILSMLCWFLPFDKKKWTIQMMKVNIIQTSKIEFNQFSDMKRKFLWRWIQVCFAQTKSVMEYFTPKTMFINSSLLLIYLLLVKPGKKHQQRLKPWMFMSWRFNRVSCFKWYGQRFHFI